MRPPKHAQRGQAIVETVIFLPLLILALFGTIWCVQIAVQHERVESAIRYFSTITERSDPFPNYSFASMFSQLGSSTLPAELCAGPSTDPLSDANPTYQSTHADNTTASPPFWSATQPTTGCTSQGTIWGMQQNYLNRNNTGLPQANMDMLFIAKTPEVSGSVPVPSQLQAAVGGASTARSRETIFEQVGVNVLVACYPGFNNLLYTSTINWANDPSPATPPGPLGASDLVAADEGKFDYFTPSPSCVYVGAAP